MNPTLILEKIQCYIYKEDINKLIQQVCKHLCMFLNINLLRLILQLKLKLNVKYSEWPHDVYIHGVIWIGCK